MRNFSVVFSFIILFFIASCAQSPQQNNPLPETPVVPRIERGIRVDISLYGNEPTAKIVHDNTLTGQVFQDAANPDEITFANDGAPLAVTNIVHNGKRYISASFEVVNGSSSDLQNVYFIARDGVVDDVDTPFGLVNNFAGERITPPSSMKLDDAYIYNEVTNSVEIDASDYVSVTTSAINQATIDDAYKPQLFNQAFLAKSLDRSSKQIAQGAKGKVTFSVSVDELTGQANDPFSFSIYIYAVTDVVPARGCTDIQCIHEIQGDGADSPLVGQTVTVDGVVTAVYPHMRGFFLQEEAADMDDNPATSEGVFVQRIFAPRVTIGDRVEVQGEVFEQNGATILGNISAVKLMGAEAQLPDATVITLPLPETVLDVNAFYEQYEGMLVTFDNTLTIVGHDDLAQEGSIVLAQGERFRQYTDIAEIPTALGYAQHLLMLARRSIVLDDDRNNPYAFLGGTDGDTPEEDSAYSYPVGGLSFTSYFRAGDSLNTLSGIMDYSETWRVRPIWDSYDYTITAANNRPRFHDDIGANQQTPQIKVMSFNVGDYFSTLDSGGAHSQQELRNQISKLEVAICTAGADVVALTGIENDADSIDNLVAVLNEGSDQNGDGLLKRRTCQDNNLTPFVAVTLPAALGGSSDMVSISNHDTAVALLYRSDVLSLVGASNVLESDDFVQPDAEGNDANAVALAQSFRAISNNGVFTVVVNAFKERTGTGQGEDADQNDGQGSFNQTRVNAATALMNWLATDPTQVADSDATNDVLIVGTLNAYRNEAPISVIKAGADTEVDTDNYSDMIAAFEEEGGFTYNTLYNGQLGYLDHALASAGLASQVTGVTAWHINADELRLFDYNDDIHDAPEGDLVPEGTELWFERKSTANSLYEVSPYRSAEHDPMMIGLNLEPDAAPPAVIEVSPTVLETNENGQTASFTITLSRAASSILSIPLTSDNPGEGTVPETIEIVAGDISTDVTVTPVDDLVQDGDKTYIITLGAVISDDEGFNGLDPEDVQVTNRDSGIAATGALAWINEIHYYEGNSNLAQIPDNQSGFIEVIIPPGFNADELYIITYDGDTGRAYFPIPNALQTSLGGYQVWHYAFAPGILQDGPSDGVALCQGYDSPVVVGADTDFPQFVSYAGTLTAVNDCAQGLTSVDIGVVESETPEGALQSLELTGTGSAYEDFTWRVSEQATRDAVNNGQVLQ